MTTSVPFYLDFISPYSYLAWVQLRRRENALALQLEARPVLFAGLLDAHGTLGPAEIEAKRKYVFVDCLRKAAALQIPLKPPFGHPFNPLLPLRLATAAGPQDRSTVVDLLYSATWEDGIEVSDATALAAYLDQHASKLDFGGLFGRATSPEVKLALRQETQDAVGAGVFGVPSILVQSELFWGVDSLDALETTLARGSLVTDEMRKEWQAVQPLAQRKRETRASD